ncbi:Patatin-like protein 6 [Glycine soja]
MRGILAGKALAYLEGMLKKKSGNQNATIANYFDMAIDVGVGGIFTAMLFSTKDHCCPIFSADDTWRFLAEKGNKFYRAGYDASNRGFLKRLLFSGCSDSVSSTTTSFEKAMKKVFTTENGGSILCNNSGSAGHKYPHSQQIPQKKPIVHGQGVMRLTKIMS